MVSGKSWPVTTRDDDDDDDVSPLLSVAEIGTPRPSRMIWRSTDLYDARARVYVPSTRPVSVCVVDVIYTRTRDDVFRCSDDDAKDVMMIID